MQGVYRRTEGACADEGVFQVCTHPPVITGGGVTRQYHTLTAPPVDIAGHTHSYSLADTLTQVAPRKQGFVSQAVIGWEQRNPSGRKGKLAGKKG